jgi:Tol biopolymer transport system component
MNTSCLNKCFSLFLLRSLVILALLEACSPLEEEVPATPTVMTPGMTTKVSDTSMPDIAVTPNATPTARIFRDGICNPDESKGHIFFLRGNSTGNRNHASYYDLYVMDGNGCFPRLVLPEASGSPAWSPDGNQLAIGCANNGFLCILDIKKTLDTCSGGQRDVGQCSAAILRRFALPSDIGGDERMYNISWSSDGSQIATEGGSATTSERSIYILTLAGEGVWEILMRGQGAFNIAWSPIDDQLALSGLVFINLKSDHVRGANGLYPAWSPDGKKIAFVTISLDQNKEPYGIAAINLASGNLSWLYEPIPRDDKYYFPPNNLVIRDDGRYHRLLCWSPDSQYMAFTAEYGLGSMSHIFRLDIKTGEIVNLTAKIKEGEAFYAPAWGP